MKTSFNEYQHEKFKKILGAKKGPGKYEKLYLEKTYRLLKYIQYIPGIQMVGIGNSLSMNCAKKSSDIDLLIVSTPHTLWIVRTCVTIICMLGNERKTDASHEGKFCLSFFATTKALNFGSFAIENDIYLYFWILYFQPLLNYNNTYEKFIDENSLWANFSNYAQHIHNNKKYIRFVKNNGTREGKFCTIVNKLLKKCLIGKTLKQYEKLQKPYGIIISDHMLKFHVNDIRKKIRKELI